MFDDELASAPEAPASSTDGGINPDNAETAPRSLLGSNVSSAGLLDSKRGFRHTLKLPNYIASSVLLTFDLKETFDEVQSVGFQSQTRESRLQGPPTDGEGFDVILPSDPSEAEKGIPTNDSAFMQSFLDEQQRFRDNAHQESSALGNEKEPDFSMSFEEISSPGLTAQGTRQYFHNGNANNRYDGPGMQFEAPERNDAGARDPLGRFNFRPLVEGENADSSNSMNDDSAVRGTEIQEPHGSENIEQNMQGPVPFRSNLPRHSFRDEGMPKRFYGRDSGLPRNRENSLPKYSQKFPHNDSFSPRDNARYLPTDSIREGLQAQPRSPQTPGVYRRKRDEDEQSSSSSMIVAGTSKRSKLIPVDDHSVPMNSATPIPRTISNHGPPHLLDENENFLSRVLRFCANVETLDKALDAVRSYSAQIHGDKMLPTIVSAAKKLLVSACRARRIRIAQEAHSILLDVRSPSDQLSTQEFVELLSLFVATGKKELLEEALSANRFISLSLANIAVIWQTPLLTPRKSNAVVAVLTKLLFVCLEKGGNEAFDSGTNEFFGIVVLDLIAAGGIGDLLNKLLLKFGVGNVPSRISYLGPTQVVPPRSGVKFKRGVIIAAINHFVKIGDAVAATECLKHLYDAGYAFDESSLFSVFKLTLSSPGIDESYIKEVFKMVKSIIGVQLSNPTLFDDVLKTACENGMIEFAIDIVEHMAQAKARPLSWSSVLPVMRLSASWDHLQNFVGVFNIFFTANEDSSSSTPHSDMDPVLIAELLTNCVSHGMYTHAFWYFKYMTHAGIPRSDEVYRVLTYSFEVDCKTLKNEVSGFWADAKANQYSFNPDQLITLFKAMISHGGLEAKKSALEIYDSCTPVERLRIRQSVNPMVLLDFIFYFDRQTEGFSMLEDAFEADPQWPSTITESFAILLFQKAGDLGRFDILQLLIQRLRGSSQFAPNRQLIRSMLGCLAVVRSVDPARVVLSVQIYVWGLKSNATGYIKAKELANLCIRLDECWCLLDIRIHFLRCLEWMHKEVVRGQLSIDSDIRVFLPAVCSVLNNNPSGYAVVKLKGPVLANCVKHEMRQWFSNRIDAHVETDGGSGMDARAFLVLSYKSVNDWLHYIFGGGGGFDTDSIFNAIPEIRNKDLEGGTLIVSKENDAGRRAEPRRGDYDSVNKFARRDGGTKNRDSDFVQHPQRSMNYEPISRKFGGHQIGGSDALLDVSRNPKRSDVLRGGRDYDQRREQYHQRGFGSGPGRNDFKESGSFNDQHGGFDRNAYSQQQNAPRNYDH
ncbi:hypothetical protein HDU83_002408 [Entophlyctis luteolus]|nr:hypothetical protein HDU83_002408 [Entophlyctis luteolus]